MKLRKRKVLGQTPRAFDVVFHGKLIRRFYTLASARKFADVADRLRMGEEEWEAHQKELAREEAMQKWLHKYVTNPKQQGANNVRGT